MQACPCAKFRSLRELQGGGSHATHCTPYATPHVPYLHAAHTACRMSRRTLDAKMHGCAIKKYANRYGKTPQAAQISILPLDKTDMATLCMLLAARLAARALDAPLSKLKILTCSRDPSLKYLLAALCRFC